MTDKNAKSYLMGMKVGTRGFLASPITNLSSILINSKFRMQYGGPKCEMLKVMSHKVFCGIHFSDDRHSVKMWIWGFFGPLIINLTSDFYDLIWRIQDGDQK